MPIYTQMLNLDLQYFLYINAYKDALFVPAAFIANMCSVQFIFGFLEVMTALYRKNQFSISFLDHATRQFIHTPLAVFYIWLDHISSLIATLILIKLFCLPIRNFLCDFLTSILLLSRFFNKNIIPNSLQPCLLYRRCAIKVS